MLVMLCIMGKYEDSDNNNNKGVRIIFCSEKVKRLIDMWEDKDTSQVLDLTHEDSEGYENCERTNEREQLSALCRLVPCEDSNT